MLKWTFGYYNCFNSRKHDFMRENAAFIQLLIYLDWHNQLLNTINKQEALGSLYSCAS